MYVNKVEMQPNKIDKNMYLLFLKAIYFWGNGTELVPLVGTRPDI